MPKSKRDKKISLTQTKKKGLELKQKLVEEIHNSVDKYARIFTFSVQNMRNVQLKEVRQEWRHSRFFFGKNRVMRLALGKSEDDEFRENLSKLTSQLKGQTGLLFTNETEKKVLKYFDNLRVPDFARSGTVATQTVILDEGPLPDFSHSMEPQLRQLGLPTSLKRGVVTLLKEHKVCDVGEVLTPEQARVLKLFGHKMAEFHVTIEGVWSNDGKWKVFSERPEPIVPTKVRVKANQETDRADDEEDMAFDNLTGDDKVDDDDDDDESNDDDKNESKDDDDDGEGG